MNISVNDIKRILDSNKIEYIYEGVNEISVEGYSAFNNYKDNTITWIGREEIARECKLDAKLIVIQKGLKISNCKNLFICSNSKKAFFTIIEAFFETDDGVPDMGQGTVIGENVVIGKNVRIGHNCTIVGNINIGDNTVIYHNVTIVNNVCIGDNCEIQSGVRIGHDGFGYSEDSDGRKTMVKHHGGVIIEDDVFIGSNTEIARGTIDNTIVGAGSKIDSLIHIAHNVKLGKNNGIVSGTTVYGSVKTGENCYIATSVIRDQITLGDNVFVGMNSTVTHSFPGDCTIVGSPARISVNRK